MIKTARTSSIPGLYRDDYCHLITTRHLNNDLETVLDNLNVGTSKELHGPILMGNK